MTKTIVILSLAVAVAVIAAVVAIYAASSSRTVAVAVDAKGVVVPVVPLTEPLVSESRVVGFVEECLRKAFSHDFLHVAQTIPVAQECFTPDSADKYAISMQPFIKLMEDKRMVMAVTIPFPPRVTRVYKKGTALGEVVHWDVQSKIEIFFEGRDQRITPQKNNVAITLKRVPIEDSPRGILIDVFNVGPGK